MTDNPSPEGNESVSLRKSIRAHASAVGQKLRAFSDRHITAPVGPRVRSAGRTFLASVGAITVVAIATGAIIFTLNGALWQALGDVLIYAWLKWSDPLNTIISALATVIVAIFVAKMTVRPAEKQATFAILAAAQNENEHLYKLLDLIEDSEQWVFNINLNNPSENYKDIEKIRSIYEDIARYISIFIGFDYIYNSAIDVHKILGDIIGNVLIISGQGAGGDLFVDYIMDTREKTELYEKSCRDFRAKYRRACGDIEYVISKSRNALMK